MKYDKFQDIPQFPQAYYRTDVSISYLIDTLANYDSPEMGSPLILNPDFQRGHVWTEEQQISFMEFLLMGGTTGKEIYFNCSSWQYGFDTPIYCVDGLQRLTAALRFVKNEMPVFGTLYKDFKDKPRITHNRFSFNILNLKNKKELLNLYIMFNSGGTVHKPEEIARIRKMMAETGDDETI